MTDEGRGGEYQRRVLALGHEELVLLWTGLRARVSPPDWPAGVLLEYLILRAFQLEGAEVTWPYRVHRNGVLLEQIDGAIHCGGVTCLVESKGMTRPVDAVPIIKLKARLMRRPRLAMGAVFSLSGFTEDAASLVQMLPPANVLMWRGAEIDLALRRRLLCEGMKRKLRYALEHGFPDLDLMTQEGFP